MNARADQKVTVLVVEDEPMLLVNALDFLEDAGFGTVGAANADAAIEILETRDDIRIIFTDVQMPGSMDGIKLARAVRDRWPPISIVVASGRVASPDLPAGSVFFTKPFDPEKVVAEMHRLVA